MQLHFKYFKINERRMDMDIPYLTLPYPTLLCNVMYYDDDEAEEVEGKWKMNENT